MVTLASSAWSVSIGVPSAPTVRTTASGLISTRSASFSIATW